MEKNVVMRENKMKGLLFIIALGVVIILFVGFGPMRLSAGSFLASAVDLARRTFAPSEVLVGEIPSGESVKPSAKTKSVSASSVKVVAKPAGAVSQTNFSKSGEIKELNDKINSLETQISNLAAISTPSPATSSLTSNSSSSPSNPAPVVTPTGVGKILISEIMAGADGNANYEFIELYNAGSASVDLTGWSIKKKTSPGSESSLVAASRLLGKTIFPGKYFLIAHAEKYTGSVAGDADWAVSNSFAYKNNGIALYNAEGQKTEEINWTEIPAGQSLVRADWDSNQFTLAVSPTPQNSQSY